MIVYDCDDPEQLAALEARLEREDLIGARLLQAFGPDEIAEARNRGFSAR